MPDPFATLQQPRRPWLDPAALKEAFHRLGAARHPDTAGGDAAAFAEVNAAWQALRDPATRLRHLLPPEVLARPVQIPPALGDRFLQLAALRQALADFRARESSASGALAKALLAGEKEKLRREAEAALASLDAAAAAATADLRALDAQWQPGDDALTNQLALLQRQFAFLGKWSAQLREALFPLGA